jgi:outer membrane immunogenic protein
MKKILLGSVALMALGSASAFAADLPARTHVKAPPRVPAPIYSWTGYYIGGHLGGAFPSDANFSGQTTGNNQDGRFLGGVQVGYDWQFAPNWVIGVEGQYSWLSGSVNAAFPTGIVYTNNQRGIGSVTGRLGYTWGPALLYVKGGYAVSDNNERVTTFGAPTAFAIEGNHRDGYTVGAGLEYMFARNWSAKVEYQYYNFGDAKFVVPAQLGSVGRFTTDDHTVKAGINYHFNWGGPAVINDL